MRALPIALAALLTACASTPATQPAAAIHTIDVPQIHRPDGETAAWWYRAGAARAANNGAMQGRAKNVILFLGDGMSLPTVAAARILAGQRAGNPGEETLLAFEQFPNTALSRTYNTDYQTPDSAGTMTAIATGVKTRMGVIGIAQGTPRGDCTSVADNTLLSVIELAESAGLRTGIVTTTRLTHATPASVYAHGPERNWEDDNALPAEKAKAGCHDLAAQWLDFDFGDGVDIALAGGRAKFTPKAMAGTRKDDRNLVAEWQARYGDGKYVTTAAELAQAQDATRVLGLFAAQHLPYVTDRKPDATEPSLADMTRAAIAHLQRSERGFVLVVEGGNIDRAHHAGSARRALEETLAFSDAVRAADEATNDDDTLILVTADHAHTMFFAGYPFRGNPILGKVKGISGEDSTGSEFALDRQGMPYTTLGYANGPGYVEAKAGAARPDLDDVDTEAAGYLQQALVPLGAETHGGDDVGVWAKGPGSDAVRGSVEENVLYHFLVQATPRLRARLCEAHTCNADGVPVELPKPADFRASR